MPRWIDTLARLMQRTDRAVLVTVAAASGSVPRDPGAHMIVGPDTCGGSIGGGQLEFRAIGIARAMLRNDASCTRAVHVERFPLGARVGQCCGGVVHLAFEVLGPPDAGWIAAARALDARGAAWARVRPLHAHRDAAVRILSADELDSLPGSMPTDKARVLLKSKADGVLLWSGMAPDDPGGLLDVTAPTALRVVLFGAGHVGRAMVAVFGTLPMRVCWVDERDAAFGDRVPENVDVCATDEPLLAVRDAQADAVFLVLTHSHALDFELARAILDRADFRFFGMIGSAAKRANFAARLRERGYTTDTIARMRCPIGLETLKGKAPAVIAVSVAAQLLQLAQTQDLGSDA